MYPDGEELQRLLQPSDDGRCGMAIVVVGSLNPMKSVQDRVRVLSTDGISQGLRATDYKDPPKIIEKADGIYTAVGHTFQRGPLKDISRTILASNRGVGVVLYGKR